MAKHPDTSPTTERGSDRAGESEGKEGKMPSIRGEIVPFKREVSSSRKKQKLKYARARGKVI
jgi:hypothetical protein